MFKYAISTLDRTFELECELENLKEDNQKLARDIVRFQKLEHALSNERTDLVEQVEQLKEQLETIQKRYVQLAKQSVLPMKQKTDTKVKEEAMVTRDAATSPFLEAEDADRNTDLQITEETHADPLFQEKFDTLVMENQQLSTLLHETQNELEYLREEQCFLESTAVLEKSLKDQNHGGDVVALCTMVLGLSALLHVSQQQSKCKTLPNEVRTSSPQPFIPATNLLTLKTSFWMYKVPDYSCQLKEKYLRHVHIMIDSKTLMWSKKALDTPGLWIWRRVTRGMSTFNCVFVKNVVSTTDSC